MTPEKRLPGLRQRQTDPRSGIHRQHGFRIYPSDVELNTPGLVDRKNLHIMKVLKDAIFGGYLDGTDPEAVKEALAKLRGYKQEELPGFDILFPKP